MNSGNLINENRDRTPDYSLLAALKKADINQPVRQLYNDYFDLLSTFLRTKGASQDDAADLFQETILVFIDMVKSDRYKGEGSIKNYLFGIAKNLWLEEIRSRERRTKRQKVYSYSEPVREDLEQGLFHRELQAVWMKLFNAIGDICKKILVGFYYEKLSMRELLDSSGFASEQALRNKKSKCMKSLKELLEKHPTLITKLQNIDPYDK
ncbi:RNA polymerase sigma factor [Flavihumibacter stibioxidans]|uniref:RNA polymerase sigma-70 region 2 domain-containing protein n=1 Tax=Flavihumibacter stibioxidans TaxID=1834163 RepID=A0ABR7M700_9BACT|nr:sigma-70 family RNA polymerase sigma factor [Flavihumibacter stibioxidans]MBC6490510.1 hypothetical protein [Flavihumibacter stibioxidans]